MKKYMVQFRPNSDVPKSKSAAPQSTAKIYLSAVCPSPCLADPAALRCGRGCDIGRRAATPSSAMQSAAQLKRSPAEAEFNLNYVRVRLKVGDGHQMAIFCNVLNGNTFFRPRMTQVINQWVIMSPWMVFFPYIFRQTHNPGGKISAAVELFPPPIELRWRVASGIVSASTVGMSTSNKCGWKQRMLYAQLEITMISSQIISCGCSSLAVWSFGLSRPQQSCWKVGNVEHIWRSRAAVFRWLVKKHMLDPISTQRLNRFWSNVGFNFSNKCCWTHFLFCSTDGFVHSVPWEVLNHSQFPKTLVG